MAFDLGTDISAAIGLVGIGTSIYGGEQASKYAEQIAATSANIARLEGQENDVRKNVMEMTAARSQIETVRTAQRARALGIQAGATQTGSLTGSGVQAGYQNAEAQAAFGLSGIQNQLIAGRQLYGLQGQITQNKIQMANLQGEEESAKATSSLGGSILSAAGIIGKLLI